MGDFWHWEKTYDTRCKNLEVFRLSDEDIEHLKENGMLYATVGEYAILITMEGQNGD